MGRSFHPTAAYGSSTVLGEGNWFDSGNMAMINTHLWYLTCCLTTLDAEWEVAPVPAFEGETTAKLHAGTFGLLEGGKNPEAAFEVLTYILSPETAKRLANIYGGMPARLSLQAGYLEEFSTKLGRGINWDVVVAGLGYVDNPSHEEGMPGYREARNRYLAFQQRFLSEPDLDLDAELELLREDLQRIFSNAEASN